MHDIVRPYFMGILWGESILCKHSPVSKLSVEPKSFVENRREFECIHGEQLI